MSDFDSNPFADPDINNPFKVSVVPSICGRCDASLFVKTDKFLSAPLCCLEGLGVAAPFFGVAPGAPRHSFGAEEEPLLYASGHPFPRPRLRRVVPWPWSGPTLLEGSWPASGERGA